MADPLHARDLILEDARQSRGFILDDEALIEQERELDHDLKRNNDSRREASIRKGKQRENGESYDGAGGYDSDTFGQYRHDEEASSSRRTGQRRGQNDYSTLTGDGDIQDEDTSYTLTGHTAGHGGMALKHQSHADKRRRRQSYSASTPTGATSSTQQLGYDASHLGDAVHHAASSSSSQQYHHSQDVPFLQVNERRTTDRSIGSLLTRDPMKELESEGSNGNQKLTKKDVRKAYWRSILISCLFVLAW